MFGILETLNLVPLYTIATLFGTCITLWVMQSTSHYQENASDPVWIRNTERGLFMLLALTLLWLFSFIWDKGWQPHPPVLVLVMLFDSLMVLRAITISLATQRRTASRKVILGVEQFERRRAGN